MRLYLIRHGQSFNNARPSEDIPRHPDAPLTAIGQQQAETLAAYVKSQPDPFPIIDPEQVAWEQEGFGIQHLIASPMQRALQTVLPISQALGLPITVWDNLYEYGGIYLETEEGVKGYSGLSRQAMLDLVPHAMLPDSISEDGWWNRPMETRDECFARGAVVAQRLREFAAEHPDLCVGLVAHQYFLWRVMMGLLCLPTDDSVLFGLYNSAFSRLDFGEDGRIRVRYVNRYDHLPRSMITT
ncbi:MAG: histidine phosphatase family protein [Anaerolineales bacterium]|nr:histidine phosphatase family protein [Anaerolineales bacterium]